MGPARETFVVVDVFDGDEVFWNLLNLDIFAKSVNCYNQLGPRLSLFLNTSCGNFQGWRVLLPCYLDIFAKSVSCYNQLGPRISLFLNTFCGVGGFFYHFS